MVFALQPTFCAIRDAENPSADRCTILSLSASVSRDMLTCVACVNKFKHTDCNREALYISSVLNTVSCMYASMREDKRITFASDRVLQKNLPLSVIKSCHHCCEHEEQVQSRKRQHFKTLFMTGHGHVAALAVILGLAGPGEAAGEAWWMSLYSHPACRPFTAGCGFCPLGPTGLFAPESRQQQHKYTFLGRLSSKELSIWAQGFNVGMLAQTPGWPRHRRPQLTGHSFASAASNRPLFFLSEPPG